MSYINIERSKPNGGRGGFHPKAKPKAKLKPAPKEPEPEVMVPDNSQQLLATRLNAVIGEQKTTARAVSRLAGLADTYCHDVINGRNAKPSVFALRAVAKVLN